MISSRFRTRYHRPSLHCLRLPDRPEQKRLATQKKTTNLSAWDLYLQALSIFNRDGNQQTDDSHPAVVEKCMAAIELDGNFCDAYVLFAGHFSGLSFQTNMRISGPKTRRFSTRWRNGHMIWTPTIPRQSSH